MLQSELIVAEDRLIEAFPQLSGYRFFLVEMPRGAGGAFGGVSAGTAGAGGSRYPSEHARRIEQHLKAELSAQGLELESTLERLARYHAVENAYLAAFASIGGFGLVLGTLALGALMTRNVLERRGELALLAALGYRPRAIGVMIVSESLGLLLAGLAGGTLCGLVAVAPTLLESPATVDWSTPALTLALVVAAGAASTMLAVRAALRTSPLTGLRRE